MSKKAKWGRFLVAVPLMMMVFNTHVLSAPLLSLRNPCWISPRILSFSTTSVNRSFKTLLNSAELARVVKVESYRVLTTTCIKRAKFCITWITHTRWRYKSPCISHEKVSNIHINIKKKQARHGCKHCEGSIVSHVSQRPFLVNKDKSTHFPCSRGFPIFLNLVKEFNNGVDKGRAGVFYHFIWHLVLPHCLAVFEFCYHPTYFVFSKVLF